MTGTPEKTVLLVRELFEALGKRDATRLRPLFTADSEWHVPGQNLLAGTYRGPEEVLSYLKALDQLTGGTFRGVVKDVLGGEEHGAVVAAVTAKRDGLHFHGGYCMTFRFRDGRVVEARLFNEDQPAFDAFWS